MTGAKPIRYQNPGTISAQFHNLAMGDVSFGWILWFFVCFYPITIAGFGVNYLFTATPLVYSIVGGRLQIIPSLLGIFGLILICVFITASIYQIQYIDLTLRRLASFFVFFSIFSLPIIKMRMRVLNSALFALLAVSCVLSVVSIYNLFSGDLVKNAYAAKDAVGSQRIGFFMIFSFWLTFTYGLGGRRARRFIIGLTAALIFFGIFLTFSRASIVAFAFSALIYLMHKRKAIRITSLLSAKRIAGGSLATICLLTFGEYAFPAMHQFMNDRLIDFFMSGRVIDHILDPETSEGTRFRIWSDIISFVILNPVTGSGFLGTWILGEDTGSSHNQYLDVLFRVGVIGFIIYIVILMRIYKVFLNNNKLIFCGFSGVLVYGMFHETFKEPGGALLMSLLLALCIYSEQGRSVFQFTSVKT